MNISAFITVRTTSSRLPQKCLLPFGKWNMIEHIIHRTKHFKLDPIVCTSTDPSDDILEEIAKKEGVKVFRGSMINKLKRWYDCCNQFNVDNFHTVDADDPFFDGNLMRQSMMFLEKGYDAVCPTEASSAGNASVGYSLNKGIVCQALELVGDDTDTEMMWHYLDKVEDLKKIILPNPNENQIKVRLTLDYEEDYWLLLTVRRILGNLAEREDVEQLFRNNPDLYKVNWFRNSEWKSGQLEKKI
jgi:spore coat polysaccharide biosynthesis protein SpsF